jgi:hypothetical protein
MQKSSSTILNQLKLQWQLQHVKHMLDTQIEDITTCIAWYEQLIVHLCECYEERVKLMIQLSQIKKSVTNIDTRPLLITSSTNIDIKQLMIKEVTSWLQKFQLDQKVKLQNHWIQRLQLFVSEVFDTNEITMLPVMDQFQLNRDFVSNLTVFRLHPLSVALDGNQDLIKRILAWKLKCQLIDRKVFFLLITQLFLNRYLYQNIQLYECNQLIQSTLKTMKNKYLTNSFYLLNVNIASIEYITLFMIPTLRLARDLQQYHLPSLLEQSERVANTILSQPINNNDEGKKERPTRSTNEFQSAADLVKWMSDQNPITEREQLYFKKTAISHLFKFFPPKNNSQFHLSNTNLNQPNTTKEASNNEFKQSFYSVFAHAIEERENQRRRDIYEKSVRSKEIADTVYENMKSNIIEKRTRLVDFKKQFLQYLDLSTEIQLVEQMMKKVLKAIPSMVLDEFNLLFNRYLSQSNDQSHLLHIDNKLDHMSIELATVLVKILSRYELSPQLKCYLILVDPDHKFYLAVDQFSREMCVWNVSGQRDLVSFYLLS